MTDEEKNELDLLRNLVRQYELAEKDRLIAQVAQLTLERDHFKSEAYRNAETGRQIHLQAQQEIGDLQNQLSTMREVNARGRSR